MKSRLEASLDGATSLDIVEARVLECVAGLKRETGSERAGYVAGIISSNGDSSIEDNIARLSAHTEELKSQYLFPLFSASDVFGNGLYESLIEMRLERTEREERLVNFWRNILKSGHISDLFMTPGWKMSKGATDEHDIARGTGIITIHYLDNIKESER